MPVTATTVAVRGTKGVVEKANRCWRSPYRDLVDDGESASL